MGLYATQNRDLTDTRAQRLGNLSQAVDALYEAETAIVRDLAILDKTGVTPTAYVDAGTWDHNAESRLLNDLKQLSNHVLGLEHRLRREHRRTGDITQNPARNRAAQHHEADSAIGHDDGGLVELIKTALCTGGEEQFETHQTHHAIAEDIAEQLTAASGLIDAARTGVNGHG